MRRALGTKRHGQPCTVARDWRIYASTERRPRIRLCLPPLVSRVFDLPPRIAPAGLVAARRPLRHDAIEAEAAGVAEHRLALVAFHVLACRGSTAPWPSRLQRPF